MRPDGSDRSPALTHAASRPLWDIFVWCVNPAATHLPDTHLRCKADTQDIDCYVLHHYGNDEDDDDDDDDDDDR